MTWKRLAIFAGAALVVAVILVAGYYQNRYAVSQGYDIKCVQPNDPSSAPTSLTCKIDPRQNTDQSKPQPPWWRILITWPEGITAWLLLLTLGAIVWQAWQAREAAQAARDSIRLQEAGMIQWLELEKWRSRTVRQVDYPENLFLRIEVDTINKSQFPLTLQDGFIKFVGPSGMGPGWHKFSPHPGTFLAPGVPYTIMVDVRIKNEWIAEWQEGGLTFEVSGKFIHIGRLKRPVPQEFQGLLLCAENRDFFDYWVHPNPQEQESNTDHK